MLPLYPPPSSVLGTFVTVIERFLHRAKVLFPRDAHASCSLTPFALPSCDTTKTLSFNSRSTFPKPFLRYTRNLCFPPPFRFFLRSVYRIVPLEGWYDGEAWDFFFHLYRFLLGMFLFPRPSGFTRRPYPLSCGFPINKEAAPPLQHFGKLTFSFVSPYFFFIFLTPFLWLREIP